jgi:hypothetical protein
MIPQVLELTFILSLLNNLEKLYITGTEWRIRVYVLNFVSFPAIMNTWVREEVTVAYCGTKSERVRAIDCYIKSLKDIYVFQSFVYFLEIFMIDISRMYRHSLCLKEYVETFNYDSYEDEMIKAYAKPHSSLALPEIKPPFVEINLANHVSKIPQCVIHVNTKEVEGYCNRLNFPISGVTIETDYEPNYTDREGEWHVRHGGYNTYRVWIEDLCDSKFIYRAVKPVRFFSPTVNISTRTKLLYLSVFRLSTVKFTYDSADREAPMDLQPLVKYY